ncbi:MAG: 16S rRNA (uracil(1498)-N(3))-methyltransferase [Acidimicrobiia bacterium]
MKHVPHVVVGAPWNGDSVDLSIVQWKHLTKVLRLNRGDRISYTDGLGHLGEGILGNHAFERGDEQEVPRSSELVVASAPPSNKDRQRFLVEKLAELGVARLRWLRTARGKDRIASGPKVFSWVLSAVEQSRGAWLMETGSDLVSWSDLVGPVVVCHPGGQTGTPHVRTVVIGPEAGFSDDELPPGIACWDLGPTILRVESAAIVAAARLM